MIPMKIKLNTHLEILNWLNSQPQVGCLLWLKIPSEQRRRHQGQTTVTEAVSTEKTVFCICLYFFDLKIILYFMPEALSSSKRVYSDIKKSPLWVVFWCILISQLQGGLGGKRKETEIKRSLTGSTVFRPPAPSPGWVIHIAGADLTPSCRVWSCSLCGLLVGETSHGLERILEALPEVLNSVLTQRDLSPLLLAVPSPGYLSHVSQDVFSGEPQWGTSDPPESSRVTWGAFGPPRAAHPWALASQMTQQMFTFVVIAFETGFREINCRLKYFKEYHISLLFLHSYYVIFCYHFFGSFFFFCLYHKTQSLICVYSKEPWFTHMCSIRKKPL